MPDNSKDQSKERPILRPFPFPFASALAIVSDVDGSNRDRYDAYTGLLVGELGLDFGDSIWLRSACDTRISDPSSASGLGFLSRYFDLGRAEHPSMFRHSPTFLEALAQYHLGNVDHFHAFSSKGPRVGVIDGLELRGDRAEAVPAAFERDGFWKCADAYVNSIGVALSDDSGVSPRFVHLNTLDGRDLVYRRFSAMPTEGGGELVLLRPEVPAEGGFAFPQFDHIERLTVVLDRECDQACIKRVLLINSPGELLLDRVAMLRDQFNVETPLVTEHSGLHFRSAAMGARRDRELQDYLGSHDARVAAFSGSLRDHQGNLIFSVEADDERSLARVLPELATDLEVRFVVSRAATRTTGWPLEGLLSPFAAGTGTVAYQAQRTLPNIAPPLPGKTFDGTQSHRENFAQRIAVALEGAAESPGLYWPIYTHLGAMTTPPQDGALPEPYLDLGPMHALQDRTLGITSAAGSDQRIWVARASTLYDYALILGSMGPHLSRTGANSIDIESWRDPVLDKSLPRSVSQLYGVTLYVDDPSQAEVRLDGKRIDRLIRNGVDDTGRPSVTIAEAEIRHTLFSRLDPMAAEGGGRTVEGGDWSFQGGDGSDRAFGRLTATSAGSAALRIALHGWTPVGCQLLSFVARRSPGAELGLMLETESGGRFFFGDPAALHADAAIDATYLFDNHPTEGWPTLVAPFFGMAWGTGASPGGPLPNHALKAVTLLCRGEQGAFVDFADVVFLRPRATSISQEDAGYCLGGAVENFAPGQMVQLCSDETGRSATQVVDQRGMFCFNRLPLGIYRVWTVGNRGEVFDRRGPLVELGADTMDLRLPLDPGGQRLMARMFKLIGWARAISRSWMKPSLKLLSVASRSANAGMSAKSSAKRLVSER